MSVSIIFMIGNPTADGTSIEDVNWNNVIQFFQLYAGSEFYDCFNFCRKYGEIVSLSQTDIDLAIRNINMKIAEIENHIAQIQEIKTGALRNIGATGFNDSYDTIMKFNECIEELNETVKCGYSLIGAMNVASDLLYDNRIVSILNE